MHFIICIYLFSMLQACHPTSHSIHSIDRQPYSSGQVSLMDRCILAWIEPAKSGLGSGGVKVYLCFSLLL